MGASVGGLISSSIALTSTPVTLSKYGYGPLRTSRIFNNASSSSRIVIAAKLPSTSLGNDASITLRTTCNCSALTLPSSCTLLLLLCCLRIFFFFFCLSTATVPIAAANALLSSCIYSLLSRTVLTNTNS